MKNKYSKPHKLLGMSSLKKRVSCLGVVGDQYKFPEKDFMLASNSTGLTNETLLRRKKLLLTGTPLTFGTETHDNNLYLNTTSFHFSGPFILPTQWCQFRKSPDGICTRNCQQQKCTKCCGVCRESWCIREINHSCLGERFSNTFNINSTTVLVDVYRFFLHVAMHG